MSLIRVSTPSLHRESTDSHRLYIIPESTNFLNSYVLFLIYCYITSTTAPVIKGADIIAQTIVDIHYIWDKNGIEIDIPPGAISSGPVTMSIQASYSGRYKFPNGNVPVGAVYWLALNPPVMKFVEKVTVRIQHCADVDSAPFFVTANCTQKTLPLQLHPTLKRKVYIL